MKLNHRLLITSGLLLAMSTVAMSTATYAWFTTNRQAKFSTGQVGIKADSNLEYRVASVNGQTMGTGEGQPGAWTSSALDENALPGATLTDVSGNGGNFFKPTMGSSAAYYSNIKAVNSNGAYVEGYFMTLNVEFRSSAAFQVYLGPNTALSDVLPTNTTSLAAAARIAYFDYGLKKDAQEVPSLTLTNGDNAGNARKESGTYSCVYVQDSDAPRFLAATSDVGGEFESATYNYFPSSTVQNGTPATITDTPSVSTKLVTTLVANMEENGTDHTQYVDNEGNTNDLYSSAIEIRIWVEGTDVHCVDTAKKSSFKATLDFQAYLA